MLKAIVKRYFPALSSWQERENERMQSMLQKLDEKQQASVEKMDEKRLVDMQDIKGFRPKSSYKAALIHPKYAASVLPKGCFHMFSPPEASHLHVEGGREAREFRDARG